MNDIVNLAIFSVRHYVIERNQIRYLLFDLYSMKEYKSNNNKFQ